MDGELPGKKLKKPVSPDYKMSSHGSSMKRSMIPGRGLDINASP